MFIGGMVTTEQYLNVLQNGFIPIIQSDPNFNRILFMQFGTCRNWSKKVFNVLEERFKDHILALG